MIRAKPIPILIVLTCLGALVSIVALDRMEGNNRFCIACHLDDNKPLHGDKFNDFIKNDPVNLAGLHMTKANGKEFKCIDCHEGTNIKDRLRIKLISSKDAMVYLFGDPKEPNHLRVPLLDGDCLKCHPTYKPKNPQDYHALLDHARDIPIKCIQCHNSHKEGGMKELYFLDEKTVLPLCRKCHPNLGV